MNFIVDPWIDMYQPYDETIPFFFERELEVVKNNSYLAWIEHKDGPIHGPNPIFVNLVSHQNAPWHTLLVTEPISQRYDIGWSSISWNHNCSAWYINQSSHGIEADGSSGDPIVQLFWAEATGWNWKTSSRGTVAN
jgi:hypothetical protein